MDLKINKTSLYVGLAVLVLTLSSCGSSGSDDFIKIPAGTYEVDCDSADGCREVVVDAFEVGKYEVTFDEWHECYLQNVCKQLPDDMGWGRENRPVINVSIDEVLGQFIPWKNKDVSFEYSIPTLEQYLVITTRSDIEPSCESVRAGYPLDCPLSNQTLPVGSLAPDAQGLYDVVGNVSEWTKTLADEKSISGIPMSIAFGHSWETRFLAYPFEDKVVVTIQSPSIGFRLIRNKK